MRWQVVYSRPAGRLVQHGATSGPRLATVRLAPGVQPTDEDFDKAFDLALAKWKAKMGK